MVKYDFNDVLENALELEKISKKLYEVGEEFGEYLEYKSQWECDTTRILLYHSISGAYDPQVSYARGLKKDTSDFNEEFKERLRNINCMDFWMSLSNIDHKFDSIISTDMLKNDIRENYNIIHKFMNGTLNEQQFCEGYTSAINAIVRYKNIIIEKIETIKYINMNLNEGIEEIPFKIRLLNQDNRLDNTIMS